MADVETTLKSVLTTGTVTVSAGVYPVEKPMDASIPAVVYKRITSTPHQNHASSGVAGLPKRDRFQITCIESTYAKLRTLRKLVDACLVGNVTNFSAVQPLGNAVEDKDEAGKVYTIVKDYYIWHKT